MKVKNERKDEWINIEDLDGGDVFEGVDGNYYLKSEADVMLNVETGEIFSYFTDDDYDELYATSFAKKIEDADGKVKYLVKKVNAELIIK